MTKTKADFKAARCGGRSTAMRNKERWMPGPTTKTMRGGASLQHKIMGQHCDCKEDKDNNWVTMQRKNQTRERAAVANKNWLHRMVAVEGSMLRD